jgi:hypothetical protein
MASRKRYVLFVAVYFFALQSLMGEIKNGYASQIEGMHESLNALNTLLHGDANLSVFQRATIKAKINKLVEYISYFELTETLLHQFKEIAPDMYDEIDALKDNSGQPVTVFVRFVSELEMQRGAAGTTNLNHIDDDRNIYQSEYGIRTVSVKIASVSKALTLLAHEFGHVSYQVRHLATYVVYYATYYQNETFNSKFIGHNSNDPSGQKATEYENLFRQQSSGFLKNTSNKMENPLAFLQGIRKTYARMN